MNGAAPARAPRPPATGNATPHQQLNAVVRAIKTGNVDVLTRLIATGTPLNERIASKYTPLILAAARDSVHIVKLLLQGGASLLVTNGSGETPLHVAVRCGNARVAGYLITAGSSLTATNSRGDTLLHEAAKQGHAATTQLLLERGAAIDVKNAYGDTPLYVACFQCELAVAQLLLDAGACTRIRNQRDNLPLHAAVYQNSVEITRLLLVKDPAIEEIEPRDDAPLHVAAKKGHAEIAALLVVASRAVLNQVNDSGATPLHCAAKRGHVAVVQVLVTAGAEVNAILPNSTTPLHYAAGGGHVDIVRKLIQARAPVDAVNTFGETALHSAATKGHVDVAMLLIESGAAVNATNTQGETPLHHAAFSGSAALVSQLIATGAHVDAKMPNHQTPLFIATKNDHFAAVAALLDARATIDIVNTAGETPLLWAARTGNLAVLRLLLSRGASVQTPSRSSKSALFGAVSNNHIDVVRFLLFEQGASFEVVNSHGEVPLHLATFKGLVEVVELLIQAGASLGAKNSYGETALHLAAFKGNRQLAELLLKEGAAFTSTNTHGDTPLKVAASRGHASVVQLLIAHGASVNKKNIHGETPLHAAAQNGNFELVQMLIEAGASVDALSRKRRVALYFAASGGNAEIVQLLLQHGSPVNVLDADSETPLVAAARAGNFDVVRLLIGYGASVSISAVDGETPLSYAAHWARLDLVQELVERDDASCSTVSSCDEQASSTVNSDVDLASPHSGSLVTATLGTIRVRSSTAQEFLPLYDLVIQRLEDVWMHLREQPESSKVLTFAKIMYRFYRLMQKHETEDVVGRLITSRNVMNSISDFHQEIDHLIGGLEAECASPIHSNWVELWDTNRLKQLEMFQAILDEDNGDKLAKSLSRDADQIQAAMLLRYELSSHGHNYSDEKLALIQALLEKVVQLTAVEVPPVPIWFLPRHEVETREMVSGGTSPSKNTHHGNWSNADVVVYADFTRDQETFEQDATVWHQLSHPNVIKLFGACHIGQPRLFVYEHATKRNLSDFLRVEDNRTRSVWRLLYEVALGLQYLHERQVTHGRLQCDNILIGSDGAARLAGFQRGDKPFSEKKTAARDVYAYRWKAPEYFRGEKPGVGSDVYSLGLCICEAVSGEIPWHDASERDVVTLARRGWRIRPYVMSWEHWDVVKKAFTMDPRKRVKMGYLVERLKQFAADEAARAKGESDSLGPRASDASSGNQHNNQEQSKNLVEYLVPELYATIPDALEKTQAKCAFITESQEMALHVHARLSQLYTQLLRMNKVPADIEVSRYCTLLTRFQRYIRAPTSDLSAVRMAKSRKAAEASHTFHGEIDKLLEILDLAEEDVDPIHMWRKPGQEAYRRGYSSSNATSTASLSSLSVGSNSSSTEFGSMHLSSAGDAPFVDVVTTSKSSEGSESDVAPTTSSTATPWFLPLHELFFDELDRIGEGSFGAVYRGTWLDTPVVVKFMGYEDDDASVLDMFLHEASVWHPLNHP
ncbi:Tkl protein kinase, partial [Globisporangium polare]